MKKAFCAKCRKKIPLKGRRTWCDKCALEFIFNKNNKSMEEEKDLETPEVEGESVEETTPVEKPEE